MKALFKSTAALLIVCAMIFAIPAGFGAVWAVNLDQPCTLKVYSDQYNEDFDKIGMVVDLYPIAWAEPSGNSYTLSYIDQFAELASIEDYAEMAEMALEIVCTGEVMPIAIVNYTNGKAEFEGLNAGCYLVVAHGWHENYITTVTDDKGNTHLASFARGDQHAYLFDPVLVSLPAPSDDPDSNVWVYDNQITLKPEEHARQRVTVEKVDSETGEALPGARFKLYSTAGYPSEDFILCTPGKEVGEEIVPDGSEQIPMYLQGYYTTDKNGKMTLDADYIAALYALVEVEAPEGYALSDEVQFFYLPDLLNPDPTLINEYELEQIKSYRESDRMDDGTWLIAYDPAARHGNVTMESKFSSWIWRYTFTNTSNTQSYYIRAKAFCGDSFYSPFWGLSYSGEGWTYNEENGYFYYDKILYEGVSTPELLVQIEVADGATPPSGEERWDISEAILSVLYEVIPVQYDADGNPYADWGDSDTADPESVRNSAATVGIEPYAEATGGYEIDTGDSDAAAAPKYGQVQQLTSYVLEVENTLDSDVPDTPGAELPETGGIGTTIFYITGGLIAVPSLTLLMIKKGKRTRRRRA